MQVSRMAKINEVSEKLIADLDNIQTLIGNHLWEMNSSTSSRNPTAFLIGIKSKINQMRTTLQKDFRIVKAENNKSQFVISNMKQQITKMKKEISELTFEDIDLSYLSIKTSSAEVSVSSSVIPLDKTIQLTQSTDIPDLVSPSTSTKNDMITVQVAEEKPMLPSQTSSKRKLGEENNLVEKKLKQV